MHLFWIMNWILRKVKSLVTGAKIMTRTIIPNNICTFFSCHRRKHGHSRRGSGAATSPKLEGNNRGKIVFLANWSVRCLAVERWGFAILQKEKPPTQKFWKSSNKGKFRFQSLKIWTPNLSTVCSAVNSFDKKPNCILVTQIWNLNDEQLLKCKLFFQISLFISYQNSKEYKFHLVFNAENWKRLAQTVASIRTATTRIEINPPTAVICNRCKLNTA